MTQPDLFSEPVTPPVVTGPIARRVHKNTQSFEHNAPKVTARTAAHCRELAQIVMKGSRPSPELAASYSAEADAIDAESGLMPMRKEQPVAAEVADLGKSEWRKFLAADSRRVTA